VALGLPTAEMRERFTLVLKGHIGIATVVFPEGSTGAQIDTLARLALWRAGLDFDHGTGHGVGAYLCVHEGPGRISKSGGGVALKPGFTAGASVGALLLHELGHAVGLNHVSLRSQIMYPTIGSWTRAGYHYGDLEGLRAVGRAAGCFRTAASAPADPAAMARAAGVSVTG